MNGAEPAAAALLALANAGSVNIHLPVAPTAAAAKPIRKTSRLV